MGRIILPAFFATPCPTFRQEFRCPRARRQSPMEQMLTDLLGGFMPQTSMEVRCGGPQCCDKSDHCARREHCLEKSSRPWVHVLKVRGYEPSDINVRVDEGKVVVHAKSEQVRGDDVDISETVRSIKLPEGVDKDTLSCLHGHGGTLLIRAHYKKEQSEKSKPVDEGKMGKSEVKVNERESEVSLNNEKTSTISVCDDTQSKTTEDSQVLSVDEDRREPTGDHTADPGKTDQLEIALESVSNSNDTEKKTASQLNHIRAEGDERPPSPVLVEDYSRPNSPTKEYVIVDEDPETTTDKSADGEETMCADISNQEEVSPLMDSVKVTENDGKTQFEVSLNLKNFKPENISLRCKDNVLKVDAKKEWNNDGIYTAQELHREYQIPVEGMAESASASMTDSGLLQVSVPMKQVDKKAETEIPVVQLAE